MRKPRILHRGKVTYYVYEQKVVVSVNDQHISYNQYNNWNRKGLSRFIKTIKRSRKNEYSTATEQMSLAVQCGVLGSATIDPRRTLCE